MQTCGLVDVPKSDKEDGVDADLVIYMSFGTISIDEIGWGAYCTYDAISYQPVAGSVHINIHLWKNLSNRHKLASILHQTFHVMGITH